MSGEDEEECRSQADDELAQKLRDVGLDTVYWKQKLREVLLISNAQALLHLDQQDSRELDSHFRKEWEKRAFYKMLGIVAADGVVSAKKAVSLAPHIQIDNLLPSVVSERIHEPAQEICPSVSTHCLSDTDILQNASGGLALEGVYMSGKLEDALEKRGKLLTSPQTFRLVGLVGKSETKQHEFISFNDESMFRKTMEVMGFSSTVSEKGCVSSLSRKPALMQVKSMNLKEMQNTQTDHSYLSRTQFTYLPLASGNLHMAQLRLSEAALKELQIIENTLENTKEDFKSNVFSSMSCKFFHNFGSHANEGPLQFGGIFWRKASAKGFSLHQQDEIKLLLSELFEPNIGADCGSSTTTDTGTAMTTEPAPSDSGHYSPVLTDVIQMTVTTTGGNPDVHNLPQWESAIVVNNRTWSLIDRGIRFIPVWDIVLSNHKCDFKDVLKLASDLQKAYTILTKKEVHNYPEDELADINVKAQSIMEDAKQWKESDNDTHLEMLADLKQKLYECTKTNRSWIDTCLSHPALQEFLTRIVSAYKHSSCDETDWIKIKMRYLLEPNIYAVENFPKRSSITQWVYGSDTVRVLDAELNALGKTFTETKKQLKEAMDAPTSFETALNEAKVKGTNEITFSLNSLCRCFREMERMEEELLFISCAAASGFRTKERSFDRLLDYEDVNCLQHQVDAAHSEYSALKSQSALKAQAYVLLNGLTTGVQSNSRTPLEKEEHLTFMKSYLDANICTEVSNVVLVYDGGPIDWNRLEETLKSLVAGTLTITLAPSQTSKVESETEGMKTFMNLCKILGLQEYYPKKMHTKHMCVVKSEILKEAPITEEELVLHYLQKLMMFDSEARYVSVLGENENNETMQNENSNYEKFLNHDGIVSSQDWSTTETRSHVHPMDLQMAIFHCGDNFVRQYIYTKLSFCQFALPLLVPNPCSSEIEFPLWAFRQIKKSWKSRAASTEIQQTNLCTIVNADTPLVSFIRFGESPASKSQMLNSLLGKQKNEVFFHRHCRGSSKNGLLMEGVTEIAWYCPGGRDDDVFNDCIAFTNLHGDAREHKKQVQFLLEISTVNVILMSDYDNNDEAKSILVDCLNSPKPLLCLWADKERILGGHYKTKVKIGVKNRNEAELMDELKSTLKYMLANSKKKVTINDCSAIARQCGFSVDEDDEQCKQGESMAGVLLSLLKDKPLSSMKETFLPLQGKLWHEWCKKDKEFARLRVEGDQSVEEYRDNIAIEKQSIREAQLHKASPLNKLMRSFIENMGHHADSVKQYSLHWLQIYLDNLSAGSISQLHQEYHQAPKGILESRRTVIGSRLLSIQQAELERISEKHEASSFGIHHLFREVGQIYEASQTPRTADKPSAALPGIAADLMLSGIPLELMDGDASHVPLTWICSVLDEVIEKIGNKKLFVLSILGIQSSGKSTLLNAMFGLQFPVGAGRCTRGVHMQLVKVDEEFSKELGYDFVLIVDTEGLCAPELSNATPTLDNELATFVIGLANMTVINTFGENPSEMHNIIQIAVQAFLKMKQVKLSPSCVFVHQNVGDVTLKENVMDGRRLFQDMLDEMTRTAAEQEQYKAVSFDEVIGFDVHSQIHFFSHFWEDDPPMAPSNQSYFQHVKKLKDSIIKTKSHVLKISELKNRIRDLWNALLSEDFVFSFNNSHESAAYSKLEDMYGKCTWSLRSHLIKEENKMYNIINNRTDVLSSLTRSNIEQTLSPKYNEIRKDIETYFNRLHAAELLSQWKTNFIVKFETIKDELVTDSYKKITVLRNQKSVWNCLDEYRSSFEDQLLKKSKDLASKLKTSGVKDD
ncbi:interferon-induced very large GTPase 1-like [Petromyzon marinus]|uniref:interferon-induced very large GTPase 1-like n=1 Tax=Petromyzon marinus TaxID=7757 RepID=UPI003F6F8BCE